MKLFLHLQIVQLCRRKTEKYCSPDRRFGCETVVAHFMLIISSPMTRRHVKTCLAASIAAMLLFYNAAWAILRCCDVEAHGSLEQILPTGVLHDGLYSQVAAPTPAPSQIDCLDLDYQAEVLAGPTAPPQFYRGMAHLTPLANDFVVAKSVIGGHWTTLRRNSFTRGSPNGESSDPTLYLSLASLRI